MSSSAPPAGPPPPPAPASAPPASVVRSPLEGLLALSVFARVAGAVIALGYLLGLVPGPLAAALAGVALLSFGRSVAPETTWSYAGLASFGVIALAVSSGALRWGSSSLDAIRGAQAVLGPTLLIEPQEAAIGAGLAAGAGVVALGVWLASHRPVELVSFLLSCAEAVVVALLLATAFWGPAVVAPGAGDTAELAMDVGGWALVVLGAALPAIGLSLLLRRLKPIWSWVAVLVAAAAAVAGAVLIPGFVSV